jgi:hypothetical protein
LYEGQPEFLDWLVDPERGGSQNEYGRSHGILPSTLARWKRKDPFFQKALRERLIEQNLDPVGIADILTEMRRKAQQGDVQAAKLVLDYMKFLNPTAGEEAPLADASDLSDDDLLLEIEAELAKARARG